MTYCFAHGFTAGKNFPYNSGNPAMFICTLEEYAKKHHGNQASHPIFREHSWQEWPNVPDEEKAEMRRKLKNTFGYL